jgi:shikimate kinase
MTRQFMAEELASHPGDVALVKFPLWNKPLRLLFLTGFMGAGKTTIGRDLASLLNCEFIDLDDRIEARAKDSIQTIFATQGEPYFRELEHQVLVDIIRERSPQLRVIALGGGTIAQAANTPVLAASSAPVIFLDAPLEDLVTRCGRATNRPLFRSELDFRALYRRRLPYYLQSHLRINTSGRSSKLIAEEIAASLQLEVTR